MLTLAAVTLDGASAQDMQGDIRSLRPGLTLGELPREGYHMHSCGSDGGPPLRPIDGWDGYKDCAKDGRGLREMYVEYDDELSVLLRGNPDIDPRETYLDKFAGTKIAGHPVILSVLLDDGGVVQGLRAVTDPRADLEDRRRAYFLRNAVRNRYGHADWNCTDLGLAPGEQPVGDIYIKERCKKEGPGRTVVLTTNLYRRPGQQGVDAAGNFVPGEFVSATRLEIWSPAYVPK